MAKIVALGSALQDIYLVDHDDFVGEALFTQLKVGGKCDIDKIYYFSGGGGTNTAVTFARSGHETYFLGNFGGDTAAEAVKKDLAKEKVNLNYVSVLPTKTTGTSVVMLDKRSGERTILTCRGASALFENLNPKVLDEIHPDWLYVTSLRGDFKTLRRFFVAAEKNHTKIMFNPGVLELAEPRKVLDLLKFVEILIVNREEAAQLVPGESPLELALHLKNYLPTVIITNSSLGALALGSEKGYQLPVYETTKVKDTTGAGDAFGAGFLATLARGKTFRQSLVFAAANSSSVIRKLGAKAGILRADAELHPMLVAPIKTKKEQA